MKRIISETGSLGEVAGMEKITDIDGLFSAMQKIESFSGLKECSLTFPERCVLTRTYFHPNTITLDISKNNKIDSSRILRILLELVQNEYLNQDSDCPDSIFVSFRYQKHGVQITNGHLEEDASGKEKPMYKVENSKDLSFLWSLQTYKAEKNSKEKGKKETIGDLMDPDNLQNSDVVEGLINQVLSWVYREKTRAWVGEKLGFNVITKESSGDVEDGKQCLAQRTCVHSQEIKWDELADKAVESFELMKKIRDDPSYIIGIQNLIEIHGDSRKITITVDAGEDKERISAAFTSKLLNLVGVHDFDAVSVWYQKEVNTDDPIWLKAIGLVGYILGGILNFFSRDNVKASIYAFMLLEIPMFMLMAFLMTNSVFKAAMLTLPAIIVLAISAWDNKEKGLLKSIGSGTSVMGVFYTLFICAAITKWLGFVMYLRIFLALGIGVLALAAVFKYEPENWSIWSKIQHDWETAWNRVVYNKTANWIATALFILAGVMGFVLMGAFVLVAVLPVLIGVFILVLIDKSFWNDYEHETERYKDRFFSDFRGKRAGISDDCEIKLKITKCKRLWIWIPVKVFLSKVLEFGKDKFPNFLTRTAIKERITNLGKVKLEAFEQES